MYAVKQDIQIILFIISAQRWFIRYIFYWIVQFLNNVTIIKSNVLLIHVLMTLADLGYPV
jgi:hypothetical protein